MNFNSGKEADALGSVMSLTDENGDVKTAYAYEPFGGMTISGEADDNPFQYTGRENDGTGLYYYRARYYSPEMQRFVSEDPIGLEGGINLREYAFNNPINYVDLLGLQGCGQGSGIGDWLVPDYPMGHNFKKCCDEIASSMRKCNTWGCEGELAGKTKADCDKEFCKCLLKECLFSPGGFPCPAFEYCFTVTGFGGGAFNKGRKSCR
jgi:RHS repeat-associated protein